MIVAGGGAVISGAWAELTALAEALGAPVGTSICGKGAIAEDHPLSLGVVGDNGGRPYANRLLAEADLILYVGCKTDSVTTENWKLPPRTTDTDGAASGRGSGRDRAQLSDRRWAGGRRPAGPGRPAGRRAGARRRRRAPTPWLPLAGEVAGLLGRVRGQGRHAVARRSSPSG